MHNKFFANIKKAMTASMVETQLATAEKNLSATTLAGIQNLTTEEYSAVAGGPQISNHPPS